MEANKILTANVLDIIFDGKNKDYGAYQLRSYYKKRLTKALLITGSTLLLFLGGTVLANILNDDINRNNLNTVETILVQVHNEEIAPPPPPPPPKQQQPDFKQIVFTPPIIVEDEAVKPDEIIREIEPDVAISNKNVDSDNTQPVINAPVDETNTKVVEVKKPDEEGKIFTAVEIEAGFPGGEDAWRSYLRNTLNAGTPIDNGAGGGKYTVIVKFVVSKDGSVSDIKCENDPGFGMCDEAVRVIKKTKNWTPAVQNGQYVNAYRRQPITFLVEE
jgi:protein TonB